MTFANRGSHEGASSLASIINQPLETLNESTETRGPGFLIPPKAFGHHHEQLCDPEPHQETHDRTKDRDPKESEKGRAAEHGDHRQEGNDGTRETESAEPPPCKWTTRRARGVVTHAAIVGPPWASISRCTC